MQLLSNIKLKNTLPAAYKDLEHFKSIGLGLQYTWIYTFARNDLPSLNVQFLDNLKFAYSKLAQFLCENLFCAHSWMMLFLSLEFYTPACCCLSKNISLLLCRCPWSPLRAQLWVSHSFTGTPSPPLFNVLDFIIVCLYFSYLGIIGFPKALNYYLHWFWKTLNHYFFKYCFSFRFVSSQNST